MTRRDLLKTFTALPLAMPLALQPTTRYGRIDIERHRAHRAETGETLHVYLDGVDVTRDCYLADDTRGTVHLICRDEARHQLHGTGRAHLDPKNLHDACRLHRRGRVVIAPGDPL